MLEYSMEQVFEADLGRNVLAIVDRYIVRWCIKVCLITVYRIGYTTLAPFTHTPRHGSDIPEPNSNHTCQILR